VTAGRVGRGGGRRRGAPPETGTPDGVPLEVASLLNPLGTYVCALRLGDDVLCVLDPERALAYAATATRALAYAEYDAAIMRQLDAAKVPIDMVAHVVRAMRDDRAPIGAAATAPLRYSPIVSSRTRNGMVNVRVSGREHQGRPLGWQWEAADVRQHVRHVMEVSAGVDLDAAYRTHLVGVVGLDEQRARFMVDELGNYHAP
jgi:hypothetical protein